MGKGLNWSRQQFIALCPPGKWHAFAPLSAPTLVRKEIISVDLERNPGD